MSRPNAKTEAQLLRTAVRAATAAGGVLKARFGSRLNIREKPGAGLVTEVDVRAEKAALTILRKPFPGFGVLTEESAEQPSRGPIEARWILDPLDGTTNYIHGFPMFCVSLALEWEGQLQLGVIYQPILRDLYVAVRGRGAKLNGRKLKVSTRAKLSDSLLTTGFTYRKDAWLQREMEAFERLSAVARAIRRPGSAALDLAYTARGVFDGFWERRLSPWDWAAGALMVEEAGGKVTDFSDQKMRIGSVEILASNRVLHSDLLAAVATG